MKINAIGSAMSVSACQPIKPESSKQSFSAAKSADLNDTYDPSSPQVLEQKFDFACRLAAYYKTQYEQLLKHGGVVV